MDEKEFEAWLAKQDRETRLIITTRAALRVLPLSTANEGSIFLPALRAVLVAYASAISRDAAVIEMAYSAGAAACSVAENTSTDMPDAIFSAMHAAHSAHASAESKSVARAWNSVSQAGLSGEFITREIHLDMEVPSEDLAKTPLWWGQKTTVAHLRNSKDFNTPAFAFWREWYQGFLDGKPMDWELQRRVALIPDADWEQGPEHIAGVIEGIRQAFDAEGRKAANPSEPTEDEKKAVAARVNFNREALALSIASVLEQIAEFRKAVWGRNDLEPQYRADLLDFLDRLSGNLETLLRDLPSKGEEISDEKALGLVRWCKSFIPLATKEVKAYAAPGNVAKAVVPSGIILSCTAIGTLVGGPAGAGIGTLAGGLIVGHIKPGKAMEELLKSSDLPPDAGK